VRYAALLALLTAVGGAALFSAFEHSQHTTFWEDFYWAITTMTTLGSNVEPTTTGGEIVSAVVLLVGIGFVALLTGSFAQRFLAPEISELEQELEMDELSAEQLALRELKNVQQQLQALEIAVQQMVSQRGAGQSPD
jgi:voltage-gated potassium channel